MNIIKKYRYAKATAYALACVVSVFTHYEISEYLDSKHPASIATEKPLDYVGVKVVDKRIYESCGKHKSRCSKYYELEVDNGSSRFNMPSYEKEYLSAEIGGLVNFQRHQVDQESRKQSELIFNQRIILFFVGLILVLAFLAMSIFNLVKAMESEE